MIKSNSAILILAAGDAKRMGSPKQLLVHQNKSLIQRSIENATATGVPVLVIIGANSNQIEPLIAEYSVTVVINQWWETGISSSIQAGLESAIEQDPDLQGVLITLADLPEITTTHLKTLLDSTATDSSIVATEFQDVQGVPAYFPKKYFDQLNTLKGDKGAMVLIKKWSDQVVGISFPAAAWDIDTKQDWKDFIEGRSLSHQ